MPLTAVDGDGNLIDASSAAELSWHRVHRARPRPTLVCGACGNSMHAKVSLLGLRFFAHDTRSPACPTAGETPEHRRLKTLLAETVRAIGWVAVVEAVPAASDAGGWRADVLAIGPDGRRVAFEAQLSGMPVSVGRERAERYASDGIDTVWVTTRSRCAWLGKIHGLQVADVPSGAVVTAGVAAADVVMESCDCLRCRHERPVVRRATHWRWCPSTDLDVVLRGVLEGQLVAVEVQPGSSRRDVVPAGATVWADAVAAAMSAEIEEERRALRAECGRAIEEGQLSDAARRQADKDRRLRETLLLNAAIKDAWAACAEGEALWVGHQRHLLVKRGSTLGRVFPLQSRHTAMGFPVWVGRAEPGRLFAVVAPWPEFTTPADRERWQREGTQVYE